MMIVSAIRVIFNSENSSREMLIHYELGHKNVLRPPFWARDMKNLIRSIEPRGLSSRDNK